MLRNVTDEHFRPLLDRPHTLQLPDGSALPIQIEALAQNPGARMPYSERMPFTVLLRSLEPTVFIEGPCNLTLGEGQHLEGVYVSREPAMGRDPALAYYCIMFN